MSKGPVWVIAPVAILLLAGEVNAQQLLTSIRVRNNLGVAYSGGIEVNALVGDGSYESGLATGSASHGKIWLNVALNDGDAVTLHRTHNRVKPLPSNPFRATPSGGHIALAFRDQSLGALEFAFVVLPGTAGTVDDAVYAFNPLVLEWQENTNGLLIARITSNGFNIVFTAHRFAHSVDVHATLVRATHDTTPAYVAIVRRISKAAPTEARLRFNGRVFNASNSPDTWDRDFWYTRGVDWTSWKSGKARIEMVNGFSPVPTILKDTLWAEGSHFYVWERTRRIGDALYFISEIAGPNAEQAKSRYMPVTPYAPVGAGDTVSLKWRIAVAENPDSKWEESQLRGFAGYRSSGVSAGLLTVDLGVKSVTFGTSYFPYSTFGENFDYYRVPGMSSEAFWPISPVMWARWREFAPRMRTDLRIAHSMGFEVIRLHHVELLQKLKQEDALAFLDFFAGEVRTLGLKLLIDTDGPQSWVTSIVGRYPDIITRVELENEVLIGGIGPRDPARWTSLYKAAKAGAPRADVFFTAAGNNAMFSRLAALGVPFDRVGLHAYKHGPQWKEAFSSHVMGSAGFASDMGKPMTIGEFNWKDLTRMSPEKRVGEVEEIYSDVLSTHSVPELFEFQFHESLTFNPAVSGSASRHYEPLSLDRRPKAEAVALLNAIKKYGRQDSPAIELPIAVHEATALDGRASAAFTLRNTTAHTVRLQLSASAFDGISSKLNSPAKIVLRPGEESHGSVSVTLSNTKAFGTYHHFLEARYDGKLATGWGIISNPGGPTFSPASVLGDRVNYWEGRDVVSRIDWSRPVAVAFALAASVLELESAYQLGATLQAATGKQIRISAIEDVPDSIHSHGLILFVGTARSVPPTPNPIPAGAAGIGRITLRSEGGTQLLLLTGDDPKAVQAAVVEFQLRYWPNARTSALRITGMERGAALGNRIGGVAVDPP